MGKGRRVSLPKLQTLKPPMYLNDLIGGDVELDTAVSTRLVHERRGPDGRHEVLVA